MAGDVTYFLKLLGADGGGGGDAGGGAAGRGIGDVVAGNKNIKTELEKANKGGKKGLGATLGIKFGIASLLKQSQVFTGFIGTIFQLMGALVDVILAPFLPILIPGIRLIADMVPIVAKYAQGVYDFLDRTIFQWFSKLGWFDGVLGATKKALSAILVGIVLLKVTGMWGVAKSLLKNFFGKPLWGIAKIFFNLRLWDTIKLRFMMLGDTITDGVTKGGKNVVRAVWEATGGRVLIAIKSAWKAVVRTVWTDGLRPIVTAIRTRFMTFIDEGIKGLKRNFIEPLFRKIGTVLRFIASPFKSLWRAIAGDVVTTGDGRFARAMGVIKEWPAFKIIRAIPDHLTALFNWIVKSIASLPVIGVLMKWLNKELLGKLGGLLKGAKGIAGRVAGRATAFGDAGRGLLANAPGSGAVASMASKLSPSALKRVAQGFKAIPVLGAVAELGFGAYATYKDYQKYGAKAALGRAGLTLANTTAALFDPTGLASAGASIASNIAMDQAYKRMLDPKDAWKRDNPDIWVQNPNPMTGVMEWNKVQTNENDTQARQGIGMEGQRTSMDGYAAIG